MHNAAGMARRIARTVPWVLLIYGLLAVLTYGSARSEFLRDPATAALTVVALAAAYVLVDNLYRAPFEAARTVRVNGHLWWPAAIGWSADAIFIRNSEGHFRYALDACRAWKEDDALILRVCRSPRQLPAAVAAARGADLALQGAVPLEPIPGRQNALCRHPGESRGPGPLRAACPGFLLLSLSKGAGRR